MQQGSNASAVLTDEQILEMEPTGASSQPHSQSQRRTAEGARNGQTGVLTGDAASDPLFDDAGDATAAAVPSAKDTPGSPNGNDSTDNNDTDSNDPAWLKSLEAQPEAATQAREWRDAARDVAELDAAYFSAAPGAQSGLAARLYQSDPAAFRTMLAESARMLAAQDPQALAELAQQLSAIEPSAPGTPGAKPKSLTQAAQAQNASDAQTQARTTAFPAEAYRTFEASANEDVARRMHDAIDRTLRSTLPEGVADGARRRIGEDIFQEVHASLSSDRDLARQVGDALRDWRFDAAARQRVVGLVAGRARAVLPEVARRVVGEWTSSVLASDRARTSRIETAASRRDVTGGRLPETVPASALRSRDLDYRRLSDEQILEM